jgi:hypothetical protein
VSGNPERFLLLTLPCLTGLAFFIPNREKRQDKPLPGYIMDFTDLDFTTDFEDTSKSIFPSYWEWNHPN